MKAEQIIKKALRRTEKERGILIAQPIEYLIVGHIKKAEHNLVVMTDLDKLKHEDWVVVVAYYAMYHSSLALLAKIGLRSKEHTTTAAVLEYFFGEKIGKELLMHFDEIKKNKDKIELVFLKDKYINTLWSMKQEREKVQYGLSLNYKEIDAVIKNARDFVNQIKIKKSLRFTSD